MKVLDNMTKNQFRWRRYRVGTWVAGMILLYFLITEHRAHVIQMLPYLFLLACPLMHLFMHSGHNHKNHTIDTKEKN